MLKKILVVLAILALPGLCLAQYDETGWPVIVVGGGTGTTTVLPAGDYHWTAGKVYNVQGFVFFDDGATLTIDSGTIVKGNPGQAVDASAIIISRGARVYARGTATKPIVMTSMLDMVADTGDLPDVASSRGLWGGLILEGRAFTCASGGESAIEGVPDLGPISHYGGGLNPDCHDTSGVLQYISIRYPGSIMEANVEINGLSLAAIGDGTVVDHIEVFMSNDDDIENWGGSVNLKYTCIIYGDDDGWDTDECWNGVNQFGLMIKHPHWGDRETENDGRQQNVWTDTTSMASETVPTGWGCNCVSGDQYYSLHTNLTMIGQGPQWDDDEGNRTLLRENYRGYWYNNVFMEQPKTALDIDCPGSDANIDVQPSSTRNLPSGQASIAAGHPLLDLVNNYWYKCYNLPAGPILAPMKNFFSSGRNSGLAWQRVIQDLFGDSLSPDYSITGKNHFGVDPKLTSYEVVNPPVRHGIMNPVPASGSPLIGSAAAVPGYAVPSTAYTPVTYVGGFEPGVGIKQSWAWGWTFGSIANILGDGLCCQLRGDANFDGVGPDISDLVYLVTYMFGGGPEPACVSETDVNGDGVGPDISDLVYLVTYMFGGGPAPEPCPTLL